MVQKPKLNLAKRNAPGFAERVFFALLTISIDVIARSEATKQSTLSFFTSLDGLLRFARNDG
jgi:hypothetical protein